MKESYKGTIISINSSHIEIEFDNDGNPATYIFTKDKIPEELHEYGMPILLKIGPDLEYTFIRRFFCVTEKMQKENDELEQLIGKILCQ